MILVADSGSTKTDWLLSGTDSILSIQTSGLNPVRDSEDAIFAVLREVEKKLPHRPSEIYFYGTGCIEPFSRTMQKALETVFPETVVEVHSDLLGAARALCGRAEGIACILGTGSNSCLCNEGEIVSNVPPLGYILGDEGSGASLGKRLLGDMLKGQLDARLWDEFQDAYELTYSDVIDKVYRKPMANKFLASLCPFIASHLNDVQVHAMVVDEFRRFLQRNVKMYNKLGVPVHFIGSISKHFKKELQEAIESEGLILGQILASPVEKIMEFHKKVL